MIEYWQKEMKSYFPVMNKKLKAFTVMELAVAMLISGVVLSIAYNSMDVFGRLSRKFYSNQKGNAEIMMLDDLLRKDFEVSTLILKSGNGILCKKESMNIKYEWLPDMIIRTIDLPDTFFVKNDGVSVLFMNEQQNLEGGMVDNLQFEKIEDGEELLFVYNKNISPETLLNQLLPK